MRADVKPGDFAFDERLGGKIGIGNVSKYKTMSGQSDSITQVAISLTTALNDGL